MTEKIEGWRKVANIIHEALPKIDQALSQANVPIPIRKLKAFDVVCSTMLEVSDYEAFLRSDAYGRLLIIIGDWFCERYGESAEGEDDGGFGTMILIHNTTFPMQIPKNFKTMANEPNMVWIAFPASVQEEENALAWVENASVLNGLSSDELEKVQKDANGTANLIRSIGFDLSALEAEPDADIHDLAGAIGSDLQASARHLCERTESGPRAAGWDASQASEKAFKVLIRRKGGNPPHTHNLEKLAKITEGLGGPSIDRSLLSKIPSESAATDMRYGGEFSLREAVAAYHAALLIVRELLFAATPSTKYNIRNARFKIQRPPWFNFDTEGFCAELKSDE